MRIPPVVFLMARGKKRKWMSKCPGAHAERQGFAYPVKAVFGGEAYRLLFEFSAGRLIFLLVQSQQLGRFRPETTDFLIS